MPSERPVQDHHQLQTGAATDAADGVRRAGSEAEDDEPGRLTKSCLDALDEALARWGESRRSSAPARARRHTWPCTGRQRCGH